MGEHVFAAIHENDVLKGREAVEDGADRWKEERKRVQRRSATATTDVEEAFGRKGGGEVKRYIVENPRRNGVARLRK